MKTIGSLLGIIAMFFTAYIYIDNRYAQCEDVKKIEHRLDYKIISDQLKSIQERIWKLQDRYAKEKEVPKSVKEEQRQPKLKAKKPRRVVLWGAGIRGSCTPAIQSERIWP